MGQRENDSLMTKLVIVIPDNFLITINEYSALFDDFIITINFIIEN